MIYGIIKTVIESKNYELSDILEKIERRCFEHQLTDEQRDELVALARENADFSKSVDLFKKVEELEQRVKALEETKADEPTELYEPFVEGKWYYNGDKCSQDGKNYTCTAPEGVVCVWSPKDYPAYWKED
jgi:5'-deoxynucleotidase YfbR-like HD superfamily hydrolase